MKSLIKKLVEIDAPAGYESEVREAIRAEVEPLADEVRVDSLGNLIVRKGSAGPQGARVLLVAHMDEIGLIATHIDENGFVRFTNNGSVHTLTCIGGRVRFMNGVVGVIGVERLDQPGKIPGFEQLFIDVAARSREDCPVKVGEAAGFLQPFVDLGPRVVAKALDDRAGVAVLIETLRAISQTEEGTPHELYFLFSVQEEVGVRGATVAAYEIDPDLGLSVDVTSTGDTPRGRRTDVALGKGPAILVRDSGMLSDPRVVNWLRQAAEGSGLPYQMLVGEGGSTDARAVQLARSGVPAGSLSIPCRYVHSPSELIDTKDLENAVALLAALLRRPIEFLQKER